MQKTKDVRLRISEELHTRLQAEAAAQERSMNWLVTKAIENMLESKPQSEVKK